jgi:hypothetical protein
MSFIICDLNCIYQIDGYCNLDSINTAHITSQSSQSPCIYYEQKKKHNKFNEQAHL